MNQRTAYLLTVDPTSQRANFSRKILEQIGFDVVVHEATPHENKVLSNKISMLEIYKLIIESNSAYSYVFEDDINVLEYISLDEIIEYEQYSPYFIHLGVCEHRYAAKKTGIVIRDHTVYKTTGCRGLHAIGFSRRGCMIFAEYASDDKEIYLDVLMDKLLRAYNANIVRYDLKSYIKWHSGVIFQDRRQFPSTI